MDVGWDTVDPDKQTARPAFGKRVTRRNHCAYLPCPIRGDYYSACLDGGYSRVLEGDDDFL